jgi:TM2 domain-containing membrane protein YozV
MTFDTKGKIATWLIVALIWAIALLLCWAVKSLRADLDGVPVMLDKVEHEINWRKL